MTRIVELSDGTSSASAPTTTAVPTDADQVTFDPTGTDFTAIELQSLGEETDDRLQALENANFDNFLGYWNANTNSPALANGGGGGIVEGQYYVVSTAGTTSLDGITDWGVGDEVFFDGLVWKKRDNSDLVLSVAGKTGAVTLDAADVSETATRFWRGKHNVAITDPAVGNDNTQNYSIGSRWLNTVTGREYVATDVSTGAAVWRVIDGAVLSVAGKTGAVTLDANDVSETTSKFWAKKINVAAGAPAVGNDNTQGYSIGSYWLSTNVGKLYIATAVTTGAAVWQLVRSVKNNLTAIVAPTVTDDANSFYENGSFWYNSVTKFLYVLEDSTAGAAVWGLAAGGGGGGGLLTFFSESFVATRAADFLKGNNASFLGGGSFAGTLADETSAPLSGTNSLKYTQAAGSLNDYMASPIIPVPLFARGVEVGFKLSELYNGLLGDMKLVIYDVTNATVLNPGAAIDVLDSTSIVKTFPATVFIPSSCTQIRYGFQVATLNSGKILYFDNVEASTDPFTYKNSEELQYLAYSVSPQSSFQDRTSEARFPAGLTTANFVGASILRVEDDAANTRTKYVAIRNCKVHADWSVRIASTGEGAAIFKNGSSSNMPYGAAVYTSDRDSFTSGEFYLLAGEYLSFGSTNQLSTAGTAVLNIVATSQIENVVTPNSSFSTDKNPLTYAGSSSFTPSTLANAPIGTFITFTYAINTNTRTQTNAAAPTQTVADMQINGINVFTRAFNAASTSGNPAVVMVQVGKGWKGVGLNLYKATGKVNSGAMDGAQYTSTSWVGFALKEYNESTGILTLDAGYQTAATTSANFTFSDVTTQTNGYVVINTSSSPTMSALPSPRIAILKNTKTSGTGGGTAAAAAWQTRELNLLEGDTSFVSLNGSFQFTLGPGRYRLRGNAPGYNCGTIKTRIQTTGAVTVIPGESGFNNVGAAIQTDSLLNGILDISVTTSYTFDHYTGSASGSLGIASSLGIVEVFAQLEIEKLR